jgi:hypothetical protein
MKNVIAFLSAVMLAGAGTTEHRSTVFDVAKQSYHAHVVMRDDLVAMVQPLSISPGSRPAIQVRLQSANNTTVDVAATPAYGFSSKVGRLVFLTLVASYRGPGDTQSAHPVYQGNPIEPNASTAVGHADVRLPIGNHLALALRIDVPRAGYARLSLRHPKNPTEDLLTE